VENFARILDYLPNGRQTERGFHREPLALALGEDELKLLELVPRPGAVLATGQRVPLTAAPGAAPPPIDHVRRRLAYDELTVSARTELTNALEAVVKENAARYLRVFNDAPAVSRRFHLLELLPGIGKKTMQQIVDERGRAPFRSFAEIEERLGLKSPERLLVARIEQELSGVDDKYRLFVAR
jgi:putative nucleotide binding protein